MGLLIFGRDHCVRSRSTSGKSGSERARSGPWWGAFRERQPFASKVAPVVMPEEISREGVLALYAAAMLAAQELEEALVGLLGVRGELAILMRRDSGPTAADGDEVERLWEDLFRRPAGGLVRDLKLAGELGRDVQDAVTARNLLAHHYLRDHAFDLTRAPARSVIAGRLRAALERLRATSAAVAVERMVAMHELGLTDDHVTTPREARLMRYYDPSVDDAVVPEPFEDRGATSA